jgi:hypothetical protein
MASLRIFRVCSKLTVEDVIHMVDNRGLLMRGFDTVDKARVWLAGAQR